MSTRWRLVIHNIWVPLSDYIYEFEWVLLGIFEPFSALPTFKYSLKEEDKCLTSLKTAVEKKGPDSTTGSSPVCFIARDISGVEG